MFKRSFFGLCVFFIASLLIINSAFALSLGFDPATQSVSQGNNAIVNIMINISGFATEILTGYDLLLEYDPDILNIANDDITVVAVLGDLVDNSPHVDVDSDLGTIYLSWMIDNYNPDIFWLPSQPQLLNLATLEFFAETEGTSELNFSSIILYDDLLDNSSFNHSIYDPDDEYAIAVINEITTPGIIEVSTSSQNQTAQTVPEPATFILLGTFLLGFLAFKRKKFESF